MPATYAHYRAGETVRRRVDTEAQRVICAYSELYEIGLHGPDILFYYQPLTSNRVNRVGYAMHEKSGASFFSYAAKVLKNHGGREAYLAYIYGFLCHFALDVRCHGLIAEKMARSGLSHAEVEVELDRELLSLDGFEPTRKKLTGHIVPSHKNAEVIEAFYPGISADEVRHALRGFVRYNDLLRAPNALKRQALYAAFRLAKCDKTMHGMVIRSQADPRCADSTDQLLGLYAEGERLAVRLIGEYGVYLRGEAPLDEIFRCNFESQLPGGKESAL